MQLYENDDEAAAHGRMIAAIAAEGQYPIDTVRAVYETELAQLKRGARVERFLAVIVQRRVRSKLVARR